MRYQEAVTIMYTIVWTKAATLYRYVQMIGDGPTKKEKKVLGFLYELQRHLVSQLTIALERLSI